MDLHVVITEPSFLLVLISAQSSLTSHYRLVSPSSSFLTLGMMIITPPLVAISIFKMVSLTRQLYF